MKKPKPIKKWVFSANELKTYLRTKYKATGAEFWGWFFGEHPWGTTNLLGINLDPLEDNIAERRFAEYFALIKKSFSSYADEDGMLEIENDL